MASKYCLNIVMRMLHDFKRLSVAVHYINLQNIV